LRALFRWIRKVDQALLREVLLSELLMMILIALNRVTFTLRHSELRHTRASDGDKTVDSLRSARLKSRAVYCLATSDSPPSVDLVDLD
jgi:hypothetical protein